MEELGKIRGYSLKFWIYNIMNAWLAAVLSALAYGVMFSLISGKLEAYSILGYYFAMSIMTSQIQSGMGMYGLMSRALSFGSTRAEAWAGMQVHGLLNCLLQGISFVVAYFILFREEFEFYMMGAFLGVYVMVLAFVRMMSAVLVKSENKLLNVIIYVLEFVVIIVSVLGCVFVFVVMDEKPDIRTVPILMIWALAVVLWIAGAMILRRNTRELEVIL